MAGVVEISEVCDCIQRRVSVDMGQIKTTSSSTTLVEAKIQVTPKETKLHQVKGNRAHIYPGVKLRKPLWREWHLDEFKKCRLIIILSPPQTYSFMLCFLILGLGF